MPSCQNLHFGLVDAVHSTTSLASGNLEEIQLFGFRITVVFFLDWLPSYCQAILLIASGDLMDLCLSQGHSSTHVDQSVVSVF